MLRVFLTLTGLWTLEKFFLPNPSCKFYMYNSLVFFEKLHSNVFYIHHVYTCSIIIITSNTAIHNKTCLSMQMSFNDLEKTCECIKQGNNIKYSVCVHACVKVLHLFNAGVTRQSSSCIVEWACTQCKIIYSGHTYCMWKCTFYIPSSLWKTGWVSISISGEIWPAIIRRCVCVCVCVCVL